MNKSRRRVLAASTITIAVLGGGAWYVLCSEEPAASAETPAATASASEGLGGYAQVWSHDKKAAMPPVSSATPMPPSRDQANMGEVRSLRIKAQNDPAMLRSLIRRYDEERDPQARAKLQAALANINQPEVLALAKRLVGDTDVARRREGLALLQAMSAESLQVRQTLHQVIGAEQSPALLVQALAALMPDGADPQEIRSTIAELEGLSRHADAAVRRQSIFQLGLWAKNGESTERLTQALQDPAPEVKQAAMFALAQSTVRSDSVKVALFTVMNNPGESRQARDSAMQALERFSLSQEEEAAYRLVRSQVHGY